MPAQSPSQTESQNYPSDFGVSGFVGQLRSQSEIEEHAAALGEFQANLMALEQQRKIRLRAIPWKWEWETPHSAKSQHFVRGDQQARQAAKSYHEVLC